MTSRSELVNLLGKILSLPTAPFHERFVSSFLREELRSAGLDFRLDNHGNILAGDGAVIAGICVSDARLKTDIRPFVPVLDKLAQLQPVHFYWRAEEYPERQFGSQRSFGLIAQEAEKLLPELVTEDARGYKAVRYNMLPLMTLQAMKEQQDQVKS